MALQTCRDFDKKWKKTNPRVSVTCVEMNNNKHT